MFDYRTMHRGRRNTSGALRPVLYLTFARRWYRERTFHPTSLFDDDDAPAVAARYRSLRCSDGAESSAAAPPQSTALPEAEGGPDERRVARADALALARGVRRLALAAAGAPAANASADGGGDEDDYGHPHYTDRFDLLLVEAVNEGRLGAVVRCAAACASFASAHGCGGDSARSLADALDVSARPSLARAKRAALAAAAARRRERGHGDFASITADFDATRALYSVVAEAWTKPLAAHGFLPAAAAAVPDGGAADDATPAEPAEPDVILAVTTLLALGKALARESGAGAELEATFSAFWHAGDSTLLPPPSAGAVGAKAAEEGWRRGRLSQGLTCISGVDPALLPPSLPRGSGADEPPDLLVVAFSSLGSGGLARPEWRATLARVCEGGDGSAASAALVGARITVVHVLDPASSWYSRSFDATSWEGARDYERAVGAAIDASGAVACVLLGDSMGGAGALLCAACSERVRRVLVFTPQTDVATYEAVRRRDFDVARRRAFSSGVVGGARRAAVAGDVTITAHYGAQCEEDVEQVAPLRALADEGGSVRLVAHDFDDHTLSIHLRDRGRLTEIVAEEAAAALATGRERPAGRARQEDDAASLVRRALKGCALTAVGAAALLAARRSRAMGS